jgi:hypothetical protein
MRRSSARLKLICVVAFGVVGITVLVSDLGRVVRPVAAFSDGPPPGFTGAPGEQTCANCHSGPTSGGTFMITPPVGYIPGQTYQVVVTHANTDTSRDRWGFQLTALAGTNMAGGFANTSTTTQIVGGQGGREYIEHTLSGTFNGTLNGAQWSFNWTAPATNVGPVTFYAAGNQADGDFTSAGDRIIATTAISQPIIVDNFSAPFDFDGDLKSDLGIFRPSVGEWWINRSSNGVTFAAQFGATTDRITPADFTGDGKTDIAFWRQSSGEWFILRSEDFSFFSFPFGAIGDIPVPGDYDGDGKADATIFRPSTSFWFVRRSSDGGFTIQQFGAADDIPVPADYDGDAKDDIAIFRPSLGQWWMNRSTAGVLAVTFGNASDKLVPGDYTGDGRADNALWRPSTGEWFILRSSDFSFYSFPFGISSDIPAPADYDGDSKLDATVFRPSNATWYSQRSTAGTLIQQFGATGDRPVANAFVP